MEIYAVVNQKGGVGKSATTKNLAAALAAQGDRVLVVDLDPQGHLSDALGLPEPQPPATLAEAMLGAYTGPLREIIQTHESSGLDVLAWSLDMFLLEPKLYAAQGKEFRLMHLLEQVDDGSYDVCLIDCPPSLAALTDNALVASQRRKGKRSGVFIPVQAEDSSLRALRLLFGQVQSLEHSLRIQVEMIGLVVNLYDKRRGRIVTTTLDALRELPLPILAIIDDRSTIREAWRAHEPVAIYDPTSEAATWYGDLAKALRASR
ncbi:ParA family protein [Nonomuraea typhae]|uniref:ParA family protein n=1 Tax=Nonomuraea typhae TaxID=2603600 RepID=UPI0012FCD38B|nr:ParA family protein [Nonomuraea typhae]